MSVANHTQQEMDILKQAAALFEEEKAAKALLRRIESDLMATCIEYGRVAHVWGFAPHHLKQAAKARGLIRDEAA